jgi:multidrug efflux system membrane fusion protein
MKRTIRAGVATLAALALLGGCGKEAKQAEPPRAVNVVRVTASAGALGASYTGDVRARYESVLGFRIPGKIAARLVDVGERVVAGQALAQLDPADQKLQSVAARQQVLAAQSSHEQAKTDLARFTDLHRQNFVSAAELDRRKTAYEVAEAQLAQARAQLRIYENQSDYTVLKADHAGVVTGIGAEVGQVVAAGQMVAKVARPGEMEVAINVPENRLAELRGAQEVRIGLWAAPERRYRGRIREIAPSAEPVTRTYTVKVSVLDADAEVQLGMTATVHIGGNGGGQVMRLPPTALFQKGAEPAVWVVDPGSAEVSLRPVRVARYTDDAVIVSAGLVAGEMVVRAGVHKLFAGEKVRILPGAPE